ncbi:MAG: DNA topoisomerase IV subunit A [Polyangiales bacterium]
MAKKPKKTQPELPIQDFADASLAEETRRRYLNYALSVITARALPDVRDGLKPVQRRILYTMHNELRLRSDAKHRKSAAVVGDVMGKFHPHGDTALYEAMVRMAQTFSMRLPLVDGRGNFGSPDGDSPAAMRYTEARLQALANELLDDLGNRTVGFRPNYDGTRFEPEVLPARFPNLLVNGSQGIAVGMATSIPPHNLGEVVKACLAMIDDPDISLKGVLKFIKGPDFPTGGELLASKAEIEEVYATGSGSLKLRGTWKLEPGDSKRDPDLIAINAIPYGVERRAVVEKIAEIIIAKKLPGLVDVRDESTEDCRIVCELKPGADPNLVMAYVNKHTPLQMSMQVNLTCLIPTNDYDIADGVPEAGVEIVVPGGDVCAPQRVDLLTALRHFLDFRLEVITRRLRFELLKLWERIHILEGYVIVFDALDETIKIIRNSEDKADAAAKLTKRFGLSDLQVDHILELRLHRLAKLQILVIREELAEKQARAAIIVQQLGNQKSRWNIVRAELHELQDKYLDLRRTKILTNVDEPAFDAEEFIVDEDAMVVVTVQGWVKRQGSVKDVSKVRVREGDQVLAIVGGSTRSSVAFFSNQGTCYVTRIVDIPATTGHGSPIPTLFKMGDGERIIYAVGMDPRMLDVPAPTEGSSEPEAPFVVAVTKQGMSLRLSLRGHRDPSTKAGRKYTRLKDGDEVVFVGLVDEGNALACCTREGRALVCNSDEVNALAGAGRGVTLIKLSGDDYVMGAGVLTRDSDVLLVKREGGNEYRITTRKYELVSRGGKGFSLFKRGSVEKVVMDLPEAPEIPAGDA